MLQENSDSSSAAEVSDSVSSQAAMPSPPPPPSAIPRPKPLTKLRRNVSVADTFNEASSSVRRLVDYFVVVSCKPRWANHRPLTRRAPQRFGNQTDRRSGIKTKLVRLDQDDDDFEGDKVPESREESSPSDRSRLPEHPEPQASAINTEGNIHLSQGEGHDHNFQPKITARYPLRDYDDNPLNPMIIQFCWDGDVVVPSRSYEMPRVHHFVLTNEKGRKVYGTCLTFFEEYHPGADGPWKRRALTHDDDLSSHDAGIEVSVDNRDKAMYLPKTLCILSAWPYLMAFREYLAQLYRLATTTNVMTAPIERYVVNLCMEIPAPPPGAYQIQVSILDSAIRFWAPPAKLPIAYVALPYQILFECLDFENILSLWGALILERKILLLSSQHSCLTVCSEILCSLLFPMRWSHLYIPLLPKVLTPMLDAPVPYLCGIVRENWLYAQQFVSEETVVVDLDHNSLIFGKQTPPAPPVPPKKWNKLETTLMETVGDVFWKARGLEMEYKAMMDLKPQKRSLETLRERQGQSIKWTEKLSGLDLAFNLPYTPNANLLNDTQKENQQSKWDQVQEAFLRFFVSLLKEYRTYLKLPPTNEFPVDSPVPKPAFDRIAFIASQKVENVPFLTEVCMTQQFDDFITRRLYSPGEPDLVFFDQSIDAKLNRSKLKLKKVETPFLLSAKAHKVLARLDAVAPNEDGLGEDGTEKLFLYSTWPETFDESRFTAPRKIPKMIAAEFDRQALLVSRLRATIIEDDEDDDILEFYGGDYDPSPEVASFTVFLFAYSALVGLAWQAYEKRLEEDAKRELDDGDQGKEEERDGVSGGIETVLREFEITDEDRIAANFCLSDLSMGLCDSCPENGIFTLKSTLLFVGEGAGEAYRRLFQQTVDQLQEQISARQGVKQINLAQAEGAVDKYEQEREVAAAQLDLAFSCLSTMALRGLSADSDAYKSLMEACGRCGDTKRALQLIELMKIDGFVADSEILSCFIAAFAHEGVDEDAGEVDVVSHSIERPDQSLPYQGTDAYSKFLQNRFQAVKGESSGASVRGFMRPSLIDDDEASELGSDDFTWASSDPEKSVAGSAAIIDWFTSNQPPIRRKRGRKRKKQKSISEADEMPVTDMLSKQLALGESLLDFLYPDLVIDTKSDSCPHCSNVLSESDIVAGWKPCQFQDFTTNCPKCEHRFVPRFVITCKSPTFVGSQGIQTPLFCEFLSPWVLRKQLQHVVKGGTGIEGMLHPSWRSGSDIRATLFWNLIVLCRRYRLPFAFLLQGSFQNRLILPRLPEDV